MAKGTTKIIWANDPFSGPAIQRKAAQAIKFMAAKRPAAVQLDYVLPEYKNEYIPLSDRVAWEADLEKSAKSKLKSTLRLLSGNGKKTFKLLTPKKQGEKSLTTFLKHVNLEKPDLIVATTHARQGVDRFFLGSFTESLMIQTKRPVLIINPLISKIRPFKKILFATDFSSESIKAFRELLVIAKNIGAHVTLFHNYITEIGLNYPETSYSMIFAATNYVELSRGKANSWVRKAKAAGVSCDYLIDEKTTNLVSSIIDTARKAKCTLISLESRSGAVASAVFGSISRQVVRRSQCPVLVFK